MSASLLSSAARQARRSDRSSPFLRDDIVAAAEEYERITDEYSAICKAAWIDGDLSRPSRDFTHGETQRLREIEKRQAAIASSVMWFVVYEVRGAR